jgi:RTX calcium-binding nonapeptide repeat (4 copies)
MTWASALLAADASPLKRVIGTGKANVLRGTPRADFIDGRAGDDILYGFAGNDRLVGGAGADRIFCGRGRDTVSAGPLDTVARDCEDVRGLPSPRPPVPEPLLGTWNRFIDETSAIDATHVANHFGLWSITLEPSGVAKIEEPEGAHGPGRFVLYGTFTATADGDFDTGAGAGCSMSGTYRWEVISDRVLRFEKVADDCRQRAAVLWGDWYTAG